MNDQPTTEPVRKIRRVYYGPLDCSHTWTQQKSKNWRWALNPGSHEIEQLGQRGPHPTWTRCGLPRFLISQKPTGSLETFQNWSLSCSSPWLVMRFRFTRPRSKREVHSTESGLRRIFWSRAGGLLLLFGCVVVLSVVDLVLKSGFLKLS